MKALAHNESYVQGTAVAGALYMAFCAVFMGKVLIPALFFTWITYALKLCLFLADKVIVGDGKVKLAVGISGYVGGAAILSAAFSLL